MAMCAVSMPHKLCWDKLCGESLRDRVGTLGGDGRSALCVTILGGNGTVAVSFV
jgi:hypothetical protein